MQAIEFPKWDGELCGRSPKRHLSIRSIGVRKSQFAPCLKMALMETVLSGGGYEGGIDTCESNYENL